MSTPGLGDVWTFIRLTSWIIQFCLLDANGAAKQFREVLGAVKTAKAYWERLTENIDVGLRLGIISADDQRFLGLERSRIESQYRVTLKAVKLLLEEHEDSFFTRRNPTILVNGWWNLTTRPKIAKLRDELYVHQEQLKRIVDDVHYRLSVNTNQAVHSIRQATFNTDIEAESEVVLSSVTNRSVDQLPSETPLGNSSTGPPEIELASARLVCTHPNCQEKLHIFRVDGECLRISLVRCSSLEGSMPIEGNSAVEGGAESSTDVTASPITKESHEKELEFYIPTSAFIPIYTVNSERTNQTGQGYPLMISINKRSRSFPLSSREGLHSIQAAFTGRQVATHADVVSMAVIVTRRVQQYAQLKGAGEVQIWWSSRLAPRSTNSRMGSSMPASVNSGSSSASPRRTISTADSDVFSISSVNPGQTHRITQKPRVPVLFGFSRHRNRNTMWRIDLNTKFVLKAKKIASNRFRLDLEPQDSRKIDTRVLTAGGSDLAQWNLLALSDDNENSNASVSSSKVIVEKATGVSLDFTSLNELERFARHFKTTLMDYMDQYKAWCDISRQSISQDQRPSKLAENLWAPIRVSRVSGQRDSPSSPRILPVAVAGNIAVAAPSLPTLSFSEPWDYDISSVRGAAVAVA